MIAYLSSGMTKFGAEYLEEGDKWRQDLIGLLCGLLGSNFKYFNPNDYYSFRDSNIDDKEVMEYDLMRLRDSDILVYCATDPKSLGSMAEIAIAHEYGKPIIVLNEKHETLHPWITNMAFKEFDDIKEMADFISFYFIY